MLVSYRVQEVLERLERTRGIYYNLGRFSAELLFMFVRLAHPKEIVEVGTANGYSAIILGAAAQLYGGCVDTIERNGQLAEQARKNIVAAGLQDVVTVHPGSAYKVLKKLPGPFEFVFFDATRQEYLGYFERVRPKLASHALLIADNVISHQEELSDFIQAIRREREFTTTILPIDKGLLLSIFEPREKMSPERHIPSVGELMVHAAPRIFRGADPTERKNRTLERGNRSDPAMEWYEQSLAKEAEHLPAEDSADR